MNKLADAVRLVLFLASRGAARKVAWLFKKERVSLAKSNENIGHHIEDVSTDEMQRRYTEMFQLK